MTAEDSSKEMKRAKNSLDDNTAIAASLDQRKSTDLEEFKQNSANGPKNITKTRNLGFIRNQDSFVRDNEELESIELHGEDALRSHDADSDDIHGEDALRTHDVDLHGDDNVEFSDPEPQTLYGDDLLIPHGLESLAPPGEDRFQPHGSEDVALSNIKRKRKPKVQR
ncbi:MAG: hypothetical protein ACXADX_03255 [Candidatus Hodarchaeales archaeon]